MKLNMNNPLSVKQQNKTFFRAWYHHKKRVRKKNYARAHRNLEIWMGFKNKEINLNRAAKLIKWRQPL